MAERSGRSMVAVGAHDSWSPPGERVSRPAPSIVAVPLSHPARLVAESGISARPSSVAGLVERLAEAHVAIAALLGVLSRALKLRSGGGRHLELCRVGEWVDGYAGPDGAPCSAACVDAGGAYLLGLAALGLSPDGGAVR